MRLLSALSLAALSFAAPAGTAIAENWVGVATNDDGASLSVDKDSIRRGSDGLVYYKDDSGDQSDAMAADCAKRLSYTLSMDLIIGKHLDDPNWRSSGKAVQPGSFAEAELKYVCANAG
jgi:hypothetical protein